MKYPGKETTLTHAAPNEAVEILSASGTLVLGTIANWGDVREWNAVHASLERPREKNPVSSIPEFELEILAAGSETLSSAKLYGVRKQAATIADDNVDTVDFANNELDITSHAYKTGDGPLRISSSGTLPTGLEADTDYWAIVVNSGTIQLAASFDDAIAGTAVAFSDVGSGTHTIADVQGSPDPDDDTKRLHFFFYGNLNDGTDIALGAQEAYTERIKHSPMTLFYEVTGTPAPGSAVIRARAIPVQPVRP